jgi:hypothetical protein
MEKGMMDPLRRTPTWTTSSSPQRCGIRRPSRRQRHPEKRYTTPQIRAGGLACATPSFLAVMRPLRLDAEDHPRLSAAHPLLAGVGDRLRPREADVDGVHPRRLAEGTPRLRAGAGSRLGEVATHRAAGTSAAARRLRPPSARRPCTRAGAGAGSRTCACG